MKHKINEITYKPSLLNFIGKYILIFLKNNLSETNYNYISKQIHTLYKKILRMKYLVFYFFKYLFISNLTRDKLYLTYKLLPFTMGGSYALENAYDLTNYVDRQKIEGCIIECGVAEGGTAAMMALVNKRSSQIQRNIYLFDSFEGLPEPSNEDFIGSNTGDFIRPLAKGDCYGSIDAVKNLFFNEIKIHESKVKFIKGWFQDTIPKFRLKEKISILRLDGDWYESTKIPLQYFYSNVSNGGVVIIDDYATCYGSRKAVDEFIIENHIDTELIPDGRGGAWFKKV